MEEILEQAETVSTTPDGGKLKLLHQAMTSDEVFSQVVPADFNSFVKDYSDPKKIKTLYDALKADEVFSQVVPNTFEAAVYEYGLGKPQATPSSANGLATQQPSGLTPQAQSVQPIPSQPSEEPLAGTSDGYLTPEQLGAGKQMKSETSLNMNRVAAEATQKLPSPKQLKETTPEQLQAGQLRILEREAAKKSFDEKAQRGSFLGAVRNAAVEGYTSTVENTSYAVMDAMTMVFPWLISPENANDTPKERAELFNQTISDMKIKEGLDKELNLFGAKIKTKDAGTTAEYAARISEEGGALTEGALGLAGSAFPMMTPSQSGFFVNTFVDSKKEIQREMPELSPEAQAAYAFTQGAISMALEKAGLSNLVQNKSVTRMLTGRVMDTMKTTFGKFTAKQADNVATKVINAFAAEAETGASQTIASETVKQITDALGGDEDSFDFEGVEPFMARVMHDALTEGVGGMLMKTVGELPSIIKSPLKKKEAAATNVQSEQLMNDLANPEVTPEAKKAIQQQVDDNSEKVVATYAEDKAKFDNLADEQKAELEDINTQLQNHEALMADPNVSEETKAMSEQKIQELEAKGESILDAAPTNKPSNTPTNDERQGNNQQEAGGEQKVEAGSEVGNGESRTAEEVKQGAEQAPTSGAIKVASESVSVEAKPSPIDKQGIIASQKWIKDLYSLPDLTRIQDKNGNTYDIKGGKVRKLTLDNNGSIVDAEVIHTDRSIHERGAFSNPDFFNEGYVVLKDPLQSIKTPTNENTKVKSIEQTQPVQEGGEGRVGDGTELAAEDRGRQEGGANKGKAASAIPAVVFHATEAKFEGLPKKVSGGKTGTFNEPAGIYYSTNPKAAQKATGKTGEQRVVEAQFKPKNPLVIADDRTDEIYNAAMEKAEADVRAELGDEEFDIREQAQDEGLGDMVSEAFAKNLTDQGYDAVVNQRNGDVIVLDETVVSEKPPRALTPDQKLRQEKRQLLEDASEWSKSSKKDKNSQQGIAKMVELKKRGAALGLTQGYDTSKSSGTKMTFTDSKKNTVKLESIKKIADDSKAIWNGQNYSAQEGEGKLEFYNSEGDQIDSRSKEYAKAYNEYVRDNAADFDSGNESIDLDAIYENANNNEEALKKFVDKVIYNGNAFEIAENWGTIKTVDENKGEQEVDATKAIANAVGSMTSEDFNRYFDRNWLPKNSKWVDNSKSSMPLDTRIQEMLGEKSEMRQYFGSADESDALNAISEIIQQYPAGAQSVPDNQSSSLVAAAQKQFKKITGLELNDASAAQFEALAKDIENGTFDSDTHWSNLSDEQKQELTDEQERTFTPSKKANTAQQGTESETGNVSGATAETIPASEESESVIAAMDAVYEKKGLNFKASKAKFDAKYGAKAKQAVDINRNFDKYKDQLMDAGIIKKVKC